jgi:hypothetical protein
MSFVREIREVETDIWLQVVYDGVRTLVGTAIIFAGMLTILLAFALTQ